jgi:signal transduction histidine kinase
LIVINAERDACLRARRASLLQSAGFTCAEACSLADAIAAARVNRNAVLMLGDLPDSRRKDACERIRAAADLSSCAVLIVYHPGTAASETAGALSTGADGYVIEPLSAENLASMIRSAHHARCAEAHRTAENQRLTALLETLFDGYYEVDSEWRIHDANPVTVRHVERQGRRVAGQTIWELWPEIHGTLFESNYRRVMRERVPVQFEAESAVQPGRYLQLACYPIRDGMAVYFRDITQRNRHERALEETNARLLRAKEDLEQFAYAVSHDLNEPARTVLSLSELMRRRGDATAPILQDLEQISAAARRMLAMISGLMSYSAAGEVSEPGVIGSEHALRWALANLEASIKTAGGEVVAQGLPEVRGDFTQISRVFQNLISNSIKYREPARPPVIQVSAEKDGGWWRFCVADNGIGFDPRYAHRIFDMFGRLHGREFEGAGIGLATCKRIIEQHGGRIWANSELGAGSRFYFTLPPADSQPER